MILADTSVWIDYLRLGDSRLAGLLESNELCIHEFVVGELACGNLRARAQVLDLLRSLPSVLTADPQEVLLLVERHRLMGCGIGYIDMHLLAAVIAHGGVQLWTRDKWLRAAAANLEAAYDEPTH